MEEELDFANQHSDIYQFEDMEVDIIPPDLHQIEEQQENQIQEFNVNKQLQQLKETYIFKQKIEPGLINAIRGKKGARRQKKARTLKCNQSLYSSQRGKQNMEMLIEQKKNKQFSQKLFILHELRAPLECFIEVEKKGFMNLQPIFRIFDTKRSKFLLSCQKQSILSSKYLFSSNNKKVSSRQKSYFGQLLPLNMLNSQWMLYDQGFDPSLVRQIEECRAQLLYAKFQQNCIGVYNSSRIKIATPSSLKHIDEYKPFERSANVLQKYVSQCPQKVEVYSYQRSNIQQKFRKKLFNIPLNLGFVVVPEGSSTPLLYFGKISHQKYALQIHPPLSVFQAFALCILHLRLAES